VITRVHVKRDLCSLVHSASASAKPWRGAQLLAARAARSSR
jgi:hypothetical protein